MDHLGRDAAMLRRTTDMDHRLVNSDNLRHGGRLLMPEFELCWIHHVSCSHYELSHYKSLARNGEFAIAQTPGYAAVLEVSIGAGCSPRGMHCYHSREPVRQH